MLPIVILCRGQVEAVDTVVSVVGSKDKGRCTKAQLIGAVANRHRLILDYGVRHTVSVVSVIQGANRPFVLWVKM